MNKDQWPKIEQNVKKAEVAKRGAQKASQELYKELAVQEEGVKKKITKSSRTMESRESTLAKAARKRVVERALTREEELLREAEELLGEKESPERALVALQKENLVNALQKEENLEQQKESLVQEEIKILRGVENTPTSSEQEALEEVRAEQEEIRKAQEILRISNPEAYFGLSLKNLKEYKKELQEGRIVETPYVKTHAEDIAAHLRASKPVLVYGHLGTGKTELAMHVAKQYLGKEALIISGSKHTSLAELYGHQVLIVDKESGATISDFFMGPIYRAMEEGRPVIIDEVNAIPHEVLISLSHILTRRPGETINVQQDSGKTVVVQEGFCIMMTGNLNQGQERYIDREDMDPTFLSRLYKTEYDFVPQKTEGTLEEEAGKENELFHILCARVMDKNGNIEAPADTPQKLWRLAEAARVIQNVFAGKEIEGAHYFRQGGGQSMRYLLKESVLSFRALDAIITQWQKEGYKYELDYYLWKEFASQGTVASDRAYLYQELQDRYGFFKSEGWEQTPSYGSGGAVSAFAIQPPKNKTEAKKFFGPRDTVEYAFGKPPQRTRWPEEGGDTKKEKRTPSIEAAQELQATLEKTAKELSQLEGEIQEFCVINPPDPKKQKKKKKGWF